MATKCFQSIQGLCLRVTKLDVCCNPPAAATADSYVLSNSFINLSLSAELEEPDEFTVKLANGKLCINEVGTATLKRYTVEVSLCNADPDLFEIIGGVNKVVDWNGDIVGYEIDENLGSDARFSMEFWTRVPADQCSDDAGVTQSVYWLLPCLQNGRVGDVTIENGPLEFTFTADAIPSSRWGVGPYDVVAADGSNTPGPLVDAIGDRTALHVQTTTIDPPCKSFEDATGVTGGIAAALCGARDMPA